MFNRLKKHFGDLENKTVAIWGLAFKPNTDDMREAPSRVLMESLWREGAKLQAYDPVAMPQTEFHYGKRPDLQLSASAMEALANADALVIVTEWDEFRQADLSLIKSKLKTPVIFDGRNLFDPEQMLELGFKYYCIGRNSVHGRSQTKSN
jgi:UDPglucose 6-dehydrogenase